MKYLFTTFISCIAVGFLFAAQGVLADDMMACGTKLIKVGDSRTLVRKKCGKPASRREVMRRGDSFTQEVWVYDFGRQKAQRRLFFDGDELTSITVMN